MNINTTHLLIQLLFFIFLFKPNNKPIISSSSTDKGRATGWVSVWRACLQYPPGLRCLSTIVPSHCPDRYQLLQYARPGFPEDQQSYSVSSVLGVPQAPSAFSLLSEPARGPEHQPWSLPACPGSPCIWSATHLLRSGNCHRAKSRLSSQTQQLPAHHSRAQLPGWCLYVSKPGCNQSENLCAESSSSTAELQPAAACGASENQQPCKSQAGEPGRNLPEWWWGGWVHHYGGFCVKAGVKSRSFYFCSKNKKVMVLTHRMLLLASNCTTVNWILIYY